jgi:hypothetical protein
MRLPSTSNRMAAVRQSLEVFRKVFPMMLTIPVAVIGRSGASVSTLGVPTRQLQEREAELLRTAGDAQVQWTNFNDRLVAIERSLQAAISR